MSALTKLASFSPKQIRRHVTFVNLCMGMFIMQMINKLGISHTEHSANDIYEREDAAGK